MPAWKDIVVDDRIAFAVLMIGTAAISLLWVHCSGQDRVSRSVRHSLRVVMWLLAIHMAWYFVLCEWWGVSGKTYLVTTAVLYFVASLLDTQLGNVATDPLGLTIVMIVLLPLYVLKQLVLGFPDRIELIPNPEAVPTEHHPPPRRSETGVAVSALRPMGTIELAGEQFNAASASGRVIDAGTPIRVTGNRGKVYLVAAQEDDSQEPPQTE